MSSAAPQKYEYMVVIPDKPGAFAKRMEVRPKHFEGLKSTLERGAFVMGGALLDEEPKEGEPLKFVGSTMVAVASSKEEVLDLLKNDIYAKEGVWDFSKIQIYPFKPAFRKELVQ